uniref:Uncharacterized protein n=1 Tax=Salmo trutta TaxID=8032 RepID=A0A674C646_SALTR
MIQELISEIRKSEPLITVSRIEQVKLLILRLQEKLGQQDNRRFYLFKPLTGMTTLSYDRTCKIWDTASGEELHTLEGRRYVVYGIIATGSFDKTCRIFRCRPCIMDTTAKRWDVQTGEEVGHSAEIISLSFNTVGDQLVTGSFDHTVSLWDVPSGRSQRGDQHSRVILSSRADRMARLWDVQSGVYLQVLEGHTDEIFSYAFNYEGDTITASKDNTCR